jgi:endonuclease-3
MRTSKTTSSDPWSGVFHRITAAIGEDYTASVNRVAASTAATDPFRILISTIISLRTRDEVTFAASDRLFARADTPATMGTLDTAEIQRLVYPAGFYRNKARQISEICTILTARYAGVVPATREELTAFPGVGRKTANLVLGLGFGVPAICVDIHVHRIANRLGWTSTTTPEQSEYAHMEIVPRMYWIPMNQWLVGFGQRVCTPRSPRCSACPFTAECPKRGVTTTR